MQAETLDLARRQFALTGGGHFLFVSLTIGLAIGIVTGLVMEFQFGMAWAGLGEFGGDVFGASLGLETVPAFFVESTFLALWLLGWDRFNKWVHLGVLWVVTLTAYLSAYRILVEALTRGAGLLMMTVFALIMFPLLVSAVPAAFRRAVHGFRAWHVLLMALVPLFALLVVVNSWLLPRWARRGPHLPVQVPGAEDRIALAGPERREPSWS